MKRLLLLILPFGRTYSRSAMHKQVWHRSLLLVAFSFTCFLTLSISAKPRQIRNVEPVQVSVAVGSLASVGKL